MMIEHEEVAYSTVIGTFLCTQLPSEIPVWITIVGSPKQVMMFVMKAIQVL